MTAHLIKCVQEWQLICLSVSKNDSSYAYSWWEHKDIDTWFYIVLQDGDALHKYVVF